MRKHLVETLGVEVEVMPNGTFEISGITEAQRREFSKRRQLIEEAEAVFGELTLAGREKANLETRQKKREEVPTVELVGDWKVRAHRVGLTQKFVNHLLHRHEPERVFELTEESIAALVGEAGLTRENATFSRRDVVRKLAALASDGLTLQQIEWAVDQVLGSAHVIGLGLPKADVATLRKDTTGFPPVPLSFPDLSRSADSGATRFAPFTDVYNPLRNMAMQGQTQSNIGTRNVMAGPLSDGQNNSMPAPISKVPAFPEQPVQMHPTGQERGAGENRCRLSLAASPKGGAGGNLEVSPASDRDRSERKVLHEPRYSTQEMVTCERQLLATSLARRNTATAQVPAPTAETAIANHPTLTQEQQTMVRTLTTSGDGVICVEGVAGAGKTYALNVVREIFESQDKRVTGLALAGRAAQNLQEEANIPSQTIARALLIGEKLQPGTVVIVDEAGMIGSRQLAKLVELTARDGAKLVLCGDPHQLQPIDAGGGFRALIDNLGAVHLTQSVRQKELWEREALMMIRHGDIANAVAEYQEHERIVVADTVMERRRQVVAAAIESSNAGQDTLVLTKSRDEAIALNELTRAVRQVSGELSGKEVAIGDHDFQVGDKIICTKNDQKLGVTNGLRGEVVEVKPRKHRLSMRTTTGAVIAIDDDYQHVDYAYAMTAHKAQGVTVDVALVVGSEAGSREWAYSVMSRARTESRYFTIATPPAIEMDSHNQVRESLEMGQRLGRAWSPTEAKESTLDQISPRF
jgi:hypothetical protein